MARVYAVVALTDLDGTHRAVGEEFDFPRETDQQKAEYDRLLKDKVISTSPKQPTSTTSRR